MKLERHHRADFALLFLTMLWGISFPLVKMALEDCGTFTFITIRFALGALILFPFSRKGARKLPREATGAGLILGISMFAGYSLQAWGLTMTTASRSGFITGTLVVMVPLLALPILKSKLKIRHLAAAFTALGGIFMLIRPDIDTLNLGDVLTFGCAFTFALQVVVLQKVGRDDLSFRLAFYQVIAVGILSLPCGIVFEGFRGVGSLKVLGLAGLLALISTAAAFWIQARFQPRTKPQTAAVIYCMEPVFATIFARIILGEAMPDIAGAALIIVGMVMAEWRRNEKRLIK